MKKVIQIHDDGPEGVGPRYTVQVDGDALGHVAARAIRGTLVEVIDLDLPPRTLARWAQAFGRVPETK